MKKLWIQYLALILCAAVMLCTVPPFLQQAELTEAEPEWQDDSYVDDYGNTVIPIPDGGGTIFDPEKDESSDTAFSMTSSEEASSAISSAMSSAAASKPASSAASSKATSSKPPSSVVDPGVSTVPIPPSSAAVSSSKPMVSSKPASSAASSGTGSKPGEKEELLTIAVGGEAISYPASYLLPRIAEAEIGGGSEPEAIKAQVIAAHTFLRYYNDIQKSAPSVAQKTPTAAAVKAANEVLDLILTVNGKPIYTPYCAATAGRTNSSEEVWGGKLSHLVSVESIHDSKDAKNWGTEKSVPVNTIRTKLEAAGIKVSGDPSTWFSVIDYTAGGYNKNMSICGQTKFIASNGKSKTITGRAVREEILGTAILKSAKFEIAVKGEQFVFTTYGYGHGVGMSQIGAHLYAKHSGWSYAQILTHYYTGVKITAV